VVEKNLSRSGNLRMSPRITKTEMKSQELSGRYLLAWVNGLRVNTGRYNHCYGPIR
jgi:hypothetical protein